MNRNIRVCLIGCALTCLFSCNVFAVEFESDIFDSDIGFNSVNEDTVDNSVGYIVDHRDVEDSDILVEFNHSDGVDFSTKVYDIESDTVVEDNVISKPNAMDATTNFERDENGNIIYTKPPRGEREGTWEWKYIDSKLPVPYWDYMPDNYRDPSDVSDFLEKAKQFRVEQVKLADMALDSLYRKIKITQTYTSFYKNDTKKTMMVYEIYATKNNKVVYNNVHGIEVIDENDIIFELRDTIPVGSNVIVKLLYPGSCYSLQEGMSDTVIIGETDPDNINITFDFYYNFKVASGEGIINTFHEDAITGVFPNTGGMGITIVRFLGLILLMCAFILQRGVSRDEEI